MSLSVGIVGLPNAGKSTLFNALASRRLAETAAHPFTTIEPHEAVVAVPDKWLDKLAKILSKKDTKILSEKKKSHNISMSQYPNIQIVPATVRFIDIAGLVRGAHKGEGLGNQFLAKIREVNAIVHVVRAFKDENVIHQHPSHEPGSQEQMLEDIEIVNLELELGGIEKKPIIYVLNVDEEGLTNTTMIRIMVVINKRHGGEVAFVCAKLEEELIDLDNEERKLYMKEVGIKESGLEQLIHKSYELLGLITFYTIKGGKELRAWSIARGASAHDAAGVVHTDFADNFIKAEVIEVDKLLVVGSRKIAREKGMIRLEGKDYLVRDGDVLEFRVGTQKG